MASDWTRKSVNGWQLTAKNYAEVLKKVRGAARVIVQAVAHENGNTIAQTYYGGTKESEVPTVRSLLEKHELLNQKLSFDALHCKPQTLLLVTESKGKYVVGLKENQKKLPGEVSRASKNQAILHKISGTQKGHGRIETRIYEFYDILEMEKAERWKNCELRTAIKVIRGRNELKTGKKSVKTSYYGTNKTGNYEESAEAIQKHWQVETNNHIRDVTLKEDRMRSKKRI